MWTKIGRNEEKSRGTITSQLEIHASQSRMKTEDMTIFRVYSLLFPKISICLLLGPALSSRYCHDWAADAHGASTLTMKTPKKKKKKKKKKKIFTGQKTKIRLPIPKPKTSNIKKSPKKEKKKYV
jgi:hypothetical protein